MRIHLSEIEAVADSGVTGSAEFTGDAMTLSLSSESSRFPCGFVLASVDRQGGSCPS